MLEAKYIMNQQGAYGDVDTFSSLLESGNYSEAYSYSCPDGKKLDIIF